jgi:hypothetical protein
MASQQAQVIRFRRDKVADGTDPSFHSASGLSYTCLFRT